MQSTKSPTVTPKPTAAKSDPPKLSDLQKIDCLTGRALGGIALKRPDFGSGKRRRFIFTDRTCSYHVMSRTTGGDLLFGDIEKEAFRKLMRRMERFSGVEILTYAVMSNHFHLLVRVPERQKFLSKFEIPKSPLPPQTNPDTKDYDALQKAWFKARDEREKRLLDHLQILYSRAYLSQLEGELLWMKENQANKLYEETIQGYLKRLCSLEHFVKELKERFTRWFNKRHDRRGTLWQDRYKSVLVEDGEALQTMAAYIDLNPLRAGLKDDPKDYRWCGYAEAVAGSKRARVGLCRVVEAPLDSWNEIAGERYRRLLLGIGITTPTPENEPKNGFPREKTLEKLRNGVRLTLGEVLRCRIRYFSDGLVLGGKDFVESAFQARREWFSETRKAGARHPAHADGLPSALKIFKPD